MDKAILVADDGRERIVHASALSPAEFERLAQLQRQRGREGCLFSPDSRTPLVCKRRSPDLMTAGMRPRWFATWPGCAPTLQDRLRAAYEAGETELHDRLKWLYRDACAAAGLEADVEHMASDGSWIADVWVEGAPLASPVALEIQHSRQTPPDYRTRTLRYLEAGVECVWLDNNLDPRRMSHDSPLWDLDYDLPLMGNATRLPLSDDGNVFYRHRWHTPHDFVRDVLQRMSVRTIDLEDRLGHLRAHLYGEPEGRPRHERKMREKREAEERADRLERERRAWEAAVRRWEKAIRALRQIWEWTAEWLDGEDRAMLARMIDTSMPDSIEGIDSTIDQWKTLLSARKGAFEKAGQRREADERAKLRRREERRIRREQTRDERLHAEWERKWKEYGDGLPERWRREAAERERGRIDWLKETRQASDPGQQEYIDQHPLVEVTPSRHAVCPKCGHEWALAGQNERCDGMARLDCDPTGGGRWTCPDCFRPLGEYDGPVDPLLIPVERWPPTMGRPTEFQSTNAGSHLLSA